MNSLIEENRISELGLIVVDEVIPPFLLYLHMSTYAHIMTCRILKSFSPHTNSFLILSFLVTPISHLTILNSVTSILCHLFSSRCHCFHTIIVSQQHIYKSSLSLKLSVFLRIVYTYSWWKEMSEVSTSFVQYFCRQRTLRIYALYLH